MSHSEQDKKYILLAWRIVGEFGFIIAAPVVILAMLGKWLDGRYGTAPLLLVCGFAVSALLSGVSVHRRVKFFGREYEEIGKLTTRVSDTEIKSSEKNK